MSQCTKKEKQDVWEVYTIGIFILQAIEYLTQTSSNDIENLLNNIDVKSWERVGF